MSHFISNWKASKSLFVKTFEKKRMSQSRTIDQTKIVQLNRSVKSFAITITNDVSHVKGASINYVDNHGGGMMVSQMSMIIF